MSRFAPGSTPMQPHEVKPTPSTDQSFADVKAFAEARRAKKNWQPPKDPKARYRRNGLPSDAEASAQKYTEWYDPHGND